MDKKVTERRLVENEALLRTRNQRAKSLITHINSDNSVISFYCECSNMQCEERIPLEAKDYEEIHNNTKDFIVKKGHEIASIEDVTGYRDGFAIVRKHLAPEH